MSCEHGNHVEDCDLCDAVDAAYKAGQASAEQRVKKLELQRDEWNHLAKELDKQLRTEIGKLQAKCAEFERDLKMTDEFRIKALNDLAELKAQAGEPVAWQHRQRGLKEYEWQEWQTVGYKPQGPESQTFQMRPLFTRPTTERPYNPLNDYAVIPMNPTEPVKAQAGEPPRVDPNWVNIKMDVSNPTTERRVMEMALDVLLNVRDFSPIHGCHDTIIALRTALNAAPAPTKGEEG